MKSQKREIYGHTHSRQRPPVLGTDDQSLKASASSFSWDRIRHEQQRRQRRRRRHHRATSFREFPPSPEQPDGRQSLSLSHPRLFLFPEKRFDPRTHRTAGQKDNRKTGSSLMIVRSICSHVQMDFRLSLLHPVVFLASFLMMMCTAATATAGHHLTGPKATVNWEQRGGTRRRKHETDMSNSCP